MATPVSVGGGNTVCDNQPATAQGNKPSSRLINHNMLILLHFKAHQMTYSLSRDESIL